MDVKRAEGDQMVAEDQKMEAVQMEEVLMEEVQWAEGARRGKEGHWLGVDQPVEVAQKERVRWEEQVGEQNCCYFEIQMVFLGKMTLLCTFFERVQWEEQVEKQCCC